jgi:phage tail tube protein FII
MQIPDAVHGFNVYTGAGALFVGVADSTLPNIQLMTDSIKGANIAGSVKFPIMGFANDMALALSFYSVTDGYFSLFAQTGIQLVLRAGIQYSDNSNNTLFDIPRRIVAFCYPTGFNLGKFEPAVKQGTVVDLSVSKIAIYFRNNNKVADIDPLNTKWEVYGTDYLAPLRNMI